MIDRATSKASDMGLLKNSIMSGDGNIGGFIGEEVVHRYLGGKISNTYDYDIIKDGVTYDVKTKRCTSAPKEEYECSVAAYNTTQNCYGYIFVRVLFKDNKWGDAWILGWMPKHEYFEKAKKLTKGDVDPSNGFIVRADCYNLPILHLYPLENSGK